VLGVKWSVCKAYHLPPSVVEAKSRWRYAYSAAYAYTYSAAYAYTYSAPYAYTYSAAYAYTYSAAYEGVSKSSQTGPTD